MSDRPDGADRGRQIRRADSGPSGAREPPVGEREREVQRERGRDRRRGVGDAAHQRRGVAERREVLAEPHRGQRQQQQRDRDPCREERRDDQGRAGADPEHLRSARRVAVGQRRIARREREESERRDADHDERGQRR